MSPIRVESESPFSYTLVDQGGRVESDTVVTEGDTSVFQVWDVNHLGGGSVRGERDGGTFWLSRMGDDTFEQGTLIGGSRFESKLYPGLIVIGESNCS